MVAQWDEDAAVACTPSAGSWLVSCPGHPSLPSFWKINPRLLDICSVNFREWLYRVQPLQAKICKFVERSESNFTRKLMIRCYGVNYLSTSNGAHRAIIFGMPTLKARRVKCEQFVMHRILTRKIRNDLYDFFMLAPTAP